MRNHRFFVNQTPHEGISSEVLNKAIKNNGIPRVINIDKSGANKEGISVYNKRNFTRVQWRQCKYLNNIVEQDHRNIKRRIVISAGFKEFESAQRTLAGIEIVNIIRKNQIIDLKSSTFKRFNYFAA